MIIKSIFDDRDHEAPVLVVCFRYLSKFIILATLLFNNFYIFTVAFGLVNKEPVLILTKDEFIQESIVLASSIISLVLGIAILFKAIELPSKYTYIGLASNIVAILVRIALSGATKTYKEEQLVEGGFYDHTYEYDEGYFLVSEMLAINLMAWVIISAFGIRIDAEIDLSNQLLTSKELFNRIRDIPSNIRTKNTTQQEQEGSYSHVVKNIKDLDTRSSTSKAPDTDRSSLLSYESGNAPQPPTCQVEMHPVINEERKESNKHLSTKSKSNESFE